MSRFNSIPDVSIFFLKVNEEKTVTGGPNALLYEYPLIDSHFETRTTIAWVLEAQSHCF